MLARLFTSVQERSMFLCTRLRVRGSLFGVGFFAKSNPQRRTKLLQNLVGMIPGATQNALRHQVNPSLPPHQFQLSCILPAKDLAAIVPKAVQKFEALDWINKE